LILTFLTTTVETNGATVVDVVVGRAAGNVELEKDSFIIRGPFVVDNTNHVTFPSCFERIHSCVLVVEDGRETTDLAELHGERLLCKLARLDGGV
jgi:hypothetical protein